MRVVKQTHCLSALDLYAEQLLSLPNVQGVGIGGTPPDTADAECCLVVYLTCDAKVNIPKFVDVPLEDGSWISVPVRSEIQGRLEL